MGPDRTLKYTLDLLSRKLLNAYMLLSILTNPWSKGIIECHCLGRGIRYVRLFTTSKFWTKDEIEVHSIFTVSSIYENCAL